MVGFGSGWFWLVLVGFGWFWSVLVGFGRFQSVSVGFGPFRSVWVLVGVSRFLIGLCPPHTPGAKAKPRPGGGAQPSHAWGGGCRGPKKYTATRQHRECYCF